MDDMTYIGGRIRRLRRQRRLSQADLAASLGISASYLNLIEHNRRNVTVPLLFSIAGYFGVEPGELAETDDARLVGDLMELFGDDIFAAADLTNQDIRDFGQSNPTIARAVVRLFDRYRHAAAAVRERSSEEHGETLYHRATDDISDFLQEHANHFPEIEAAAERVRSDIDQTADDFEVGLRAWLGNVFGFDWRLSSLPRGMVRRLTANGRTLEVTDTVPRESSLFVVCRHVASIAAEGEIEGIIERTGFPEGDAPPLARNVLQSYFAAALMMPYEPFLAACQQTRYDIDRLARRFGASFEQVCHRMTTLQRPGSQGVPLHLIRTDIAGNISKRFSLSGIQIPRHAGACPRWNVHAAFLNPGRTNVQISQMPDGETYFCVARSFEKNAYRHNAPGRHFAIGIGCQIMHARKFIYSDGIDLTNGQQVLPIGPSCRVCPRMDCEHRAVPPANYRFRNAASDQAGGLISQVDVE